MADLPNRVGQQLGNYRLIRLLGQGGFAEVYLGEHIHLGTQAAIKVLHTQLGSDDVDKFRTEARTIARLIHPHIVRVLEFGVEGRIPFLVMDYAPNGTLRKLHPKGSSLALATIVTYVKQVADALQYAHDEKLIHRDIKPENMLVGRRNEVFLSDFGIALVAQSSRYQSAQEMAGTMAYMAPEQIQGKPRPASDQYALGIVVYEWLTGDRPFHGSFTELVGQHLSVVPPSLREKVPTIPLAVEQVVMTAFAKDPKQRFASVQAFATALEQASQPTRVSLSRPPLIVPPSNSVSQSTQLAPSSGQLAPSQAPSNQTSELTGGWTSTRKVPSAANGELLPSQSVQPPVLGTPLIQAAPQALFSSPGGPYASRGISRRTMILGLGLAGLTVAGGGIALLSHTLGPQVSSPLSTPSPTARPTSGPTITSILHGAVATPPSEVNLTSEGTSDWIYWGLYTSSTVDRKNEVPPQISTFWTIGNATAIAFINNNVAYSWSDGMPDRTIANTTTGVLVNGVNNGFGFSVPASTTTRTLRVHVDVWLSQGKFTAFLDDGSGLVYTDELLNNTGGTTQAVYTLTYRSSSNGQQLTITFVEVNAYYSLANVALAAATLQ